jgi:hypothetical protein
MIPMTTEEKGNCSVIHSTYRNHKEEFEALIIYLIKERVRMTILKG